MESGDLLSIYPAELEFPFELKKQGSCTLQLKNKTNSYVAFKVKTTNPEKYCVRPNKDIVLPGKTCDVTVTMRPEKEFPPDMQCEDKFLVQCVVASTGATTEDITPEMFNKEPGKAVEEFKLRVIYVPANLAGSSSRATTDDLGVSSKDLLSIHPTELNFPFELNKQNSCHVQLTSRTEQYIAFKVKTTNPEKYCVRPNMDIVLPGKTCDVTVTMRPEKEFPPNMQCKDKFLVQFVVASTGATAEDITPEMFSGKVEEFKLRVIYVPAYPPLPVPEGSEEGSSPIASLSDNGYSNASLLEAGQQSSDEEELDHVTDNDVYDTEDSSIDDAEGGNETSSSEPEQTRSENVQIGGISLNPQFQGTSLCIRAETVVNYFLAPEGWGNTFNQLGGSADQRQYQARSISGGTVNQ